MHSLIVMHNNYALIIVHSNNYHHSNYSTPRGRHAALQTKIPHILSVVLVEVERLALKPKSWLRV